MGDPRGFLKLARQDSSYRPVCERVQDYKEACSLRPEKNSREQASRCMDCGTPFCHWACPLGNYIPEWNDYMFNGNWRGALALLNAANNLPEITGRVCPALCEYSCVLGLNDDAVTIRENELAAIESGFKHGLVTAVPPVSRTGKKAAVVGSGPAGLSCAAQLNRAGHHVVVFERDDSVGGLLRFGIPDFKLEKDIIDRRVNIWKEEGIIFRTGINVGVDYPADELLKEFDAVCLAGGSRVPRDIAIDGRDLKGIHFAMDYLTQSNRRISGERIPKDKLIDAKDKRVVVIGGGDTGSDCVGTAHRQKAKRVIQIEIMPRPSETRTADCPWPRYPQILKTTTSHKEGGERQWSVMTRRFIGDKGRVGKLSCERSDGSCFEIEADMVILALGFLHPEHNGLVGGLQLRLDERGNVKTDADYMSSMEKVFVAGDMRRGQSLVVWAISEGRRAADRMDRYLMRKSGLPGES